MGNNLERPLVGSESPCRAELPTPDPPSQKFIFSKASSMEKIINNFYIKS